ncbi:MAG: polyisoprenoid-binding protein [Alphaproteobacteria bacterium]|nr:polyisoprenoid-binding protein [Alphaproteobacteria bacterium]
MRRFLAAFLGLFVFATAGAAQAQQAFLLDKPHTQILFFVDHLGFSKSSGEFLDYEGTIQFNEAEPAKSSVDVTIKTDSLDMGDATWDEHMKAAKYFNVAQFPTMTFKSTNVEVTGEKAANITGDLTLLGVTKPVTLAVVQHNMGKHPMSGKAATGFSATGKLKRSDFGMSEGIPFVGDEVEIRIEAEAVAADPTAEGPGNP